MGKLKRINLPRTAAALSWYDTAKELVDRAENATHALEIYDRALKLVAEIFAEEMCDQFTHEDVLKIVNSHDGAGIRLVRRLVEKSPS
jgi:hypothetical protein